MSTDLSQARELAGDDLVPWHFLAGEQAALGLSTNRLAPVFDQIDLVQASGEPIGVGILQRFACTRRVSITASNSSTDAGAEPTVVAKTSARKGQVPLAAHQRHCFSPGRRNPFSQWACVP